MSAPVPIRQPGTEPRRFRCIIDFEAPSIEQAHDMVCNEYFGPWSRMRIQDVDRRHALKVALVVVLAMLLWATAIANAYVIWTKLPNA